MNPILTTKQETFKTGTDNLSFFYKRLIKMPNGAMIYCLEGEAEITIDLKKYHIVPNTNIVLLPQSILSLQSASEDFKTHYFAYSDGEKARLVKELEGKKESYTLQRSKGLGENDADMMWLTTMNPETRRLIKVMPEDVERTAQVFDLLLGDNLQGRKDHIAENGYKYLELADIS